MCRTRAAGESAGEGDGMKRRQGDAADGKGLGRATSRPMAGPAPSGSRAAFASRRAPWPAYPITPNSRSDPADSTPSRRDNAGLLASRRPHQATAQRPVLAEEKKWEKGM